MKKLIFPSGWSEAKVKRVIKHYEDQSPDEAAAEDNGASKNRSRTFMEIPNKLVPSVRKLLAKNSRHA
jgi:hypothetical protein